MTVSLINWQQNKEYSIWYFFICTHYPSGQSQFFSLPSLVRDEEVTETETASQHEHCALTETKALKRRREIQWTFILPGVHWSPTGRRRLDCRCSGINEAGKDAGSFMRWRSWAAVQFSSSILRTVKDMGHFSWKREEINSFLFCVVISSPIAKPSSIWDLNKGGYSSNNGELDLTVLSERSFKSMSS